MLRPVSGVCDTWVWCFMIPIRSVPLRLLRASRISIRLNWICYLIPRTLTSSRMRAPVGFHKTGSKQL